MVATEILSAKFYKGKIYNYQKIKDNMSTNVFRLLDNKMCKYIQLQLNFYNFEEALYCDKTNLTAEKF